MYIYIKYNVYRFKKARKMADEKQKLFGDGGGAGMAIGAGMGLASGLLGKRNSQFSDQMKLNEQAAGLNYKYNEMSANSAFGRQLQMYEQMMQDNSPLAQRRRLEEAGMSVGTMANLGSTGGGQNVGAPQGAGSSGGAQPGNASNRAENKMAGIQEKILGLTLAKGEAEVRKINAEASNIEASEEGTKASTETTNALRDILVENARQSGKGQWIENNLKDFFGTTGEEKEGSTYWENEEYGRFGVSKGSYLAEETTSAIAKTWAETNNLEASTILTSEKAKGYWQELLNATAHANADQVKAAATKLAAEHSTGEYTNWKTWVDMGQSVIGEFGRAFGLRAIGKGLGKAGSGAGTAATTGTKGTTWKTGGGGWTTNSTWK